MQTPEEHLDEILNATGNRRRRQLELIAARDFEIAEEVARKEREACARLCENRLREDTTQLGTIDDSSAPNNRIAAAIRARGRTKGKSP